MGLLIYHFPGAADSLKVEQAEPLPGIQRKSADAAIGEGVQRIPDIGAAQDGVIHASAPVELRIPRIVAQRVQKLNLIALQGEHAVGLIGIDLKLLRALLLIDGQGDGVLLRQEEDTLVVGARVGVGAPPKGQAVDFLRLCRVAHIKEGELNAARVARIICILPNAEQQAFAHRVQVAGKTRDLQLAEDFWGAGIR